MNINKKHYFAVIIRENEKLYSYVVKATEGDNLLSVFRIPGIVSANIFSTKKEAEETARFWNECYKKNGTFLFSSPSF